MPCRDVTANVPDENERRKIILNFTALKRLISTLCFYGRSGRKGIVRVLGGSQGYLKGVTQWIKFGSEKACTIDANYTHDNYH